MEPYSPEKDGITQSLLNTWRACPVKARLGCKGYYRGELSGSLIYGIVFHDCQEVCLNLIKDGKITDPKQFTEPGVVHGIVSGVADMHKEEYDSGDHSIKQEWLTSYGLMHGVLPEYFSFWKEDFFSDERKKKFLSVEHVFDVPFGEARLKGKQDGIYEDVKGSHWLLEHKTKSVVKEDGLLMTIPRDTQVLMYMLAHFIETGVPPRGVLYNIVRKPALRKKATEELEDFVQRCVKDMAVRNDFYFIRYEVAIPWERVKEFERRLLIEVDEFVSWWHQPEEDDKECTGQCLNMYGVCPAITYCNSGRTDLTGFMQKEKMFREL